MAQLLVERGIFPDVSASIVEEHDAAIVQQAEAQDARGARLRRMAAEIMNTAIANPVDVDGQHVLNPEKAEEMAYAMKPHIEKSQKWYTSTRKHSRAAEYAAESAAVRYNSDL
jgi:ribosomal protein S10